MKMDGIVPIGRRILAIYAQFEAELENKNSKKKNFVRC